MRSSSQKLKIVVDDFTSDNCQSPIAKYCKCLFALGLVDTCRFWSFNSLTESLLNRNCHDWIVILKQLTEFDLNI